MATFHASQESWYEGGPLQPSAVLFFRPGFAFPPISPSVSTAYYCHCDSVIFAATSGDDDAPIFFFSSSSFLSPAESHATKRWVQ